MELTRREFVGGVSAGLGIFCFGPPLLSLDRLALGAEPEGAGGGGEDNGNILVLLQLSGGNDGLSSVVPYADPAYGKARERIRVPDKEVLKIDGYRGLNGGLKKVKSFFDDGKVAIIEGAGYPNPNRSHFAAMDIWHAADHRGRAAGHGWVGRFVDQHFADSEEPNLVIHVGQRIPFSLEAAVHRPVGFTAPQAYRWVGAKSEEEVLEKASPVCEDEEAKAGEGKPEAEAPKDAGGGRPAPTEKKPEHAGRDAALERLRKTLHEARESSEKVRAAARDYKPKAEYPSSPLSGALATVSALIAGGLGTRIYSVELSGFDTHAGQKATHDRLLPALDGSLGAFLADIEKQGAGDRVTVVAFSEFGRRLSENGSGGTDHGVAGPMFVLGKKVKGGLYGKHPSLTELEKGDLVHTVDFRRVYATVIEDWFGAAAKPVLGKEWEKMGFLK